MPGLSDRGHLHFALLGPPQVYHGGRLLVFPSRKALALLIYLAVEEGTHSRKTLSELFWPESDAAHARATLRATVLELREVLAEGTSPAEGIAPDRIPHLLIDRDTLGLDLTSGVGLDLHTLQAAWVLARDTARVVTPLSEEVRRAQRAQLQEATRLARGEFLAGFSLHNALGFDDWTRFQREYWHLRMHLVFDQLSRWYEEAGEIEEAIATIIRWLAFSLLNEDASQRLMRLHFATGNRVAALQAYETLRAILASEVHAEPTPETMALADRIRATAPPRHEKLRTSGVPSPSLTLLNAPLVGRTREYGILLERYHAVRSRQAHVIIIEGEAGIGKTRLATEFVSWAAAQGVDVLRGQAFESSRRLSYQPLIEALRPRIDQENAPDDLLHDVWLAELARLLPELYERYPDLSSPVEDASVARNHLFEAVARLLDALAARTPLLLFLDDLHWADNATLDLLHYLARSFTEHSTPVLLLLSLRTEALQTTPHLAEWRANLGRITSLTRLPLGPLSAQDTLHLLHALAGEDQGREVTQSTASSPEAPLPVDSLERVGQRLFVETGGQPFYLIETLKLLLNRGLFTGYPGEDGPKTGDFTAAIAREFRVPHLFPPSVRELISLQLDRLSPAAFAFLVAGSVLGQDATFERLCQVADLSEKEGLVALDEILRSHLVHEPQRQRGRPGNEAYTFTHDMIREVAYVEAGETRSRIFHRRALHALQEAAVPPAKLAYHALSAGMREAAFRWSVAAGDEATVVFALQDAIEHYEQAWQLLAEQPIGRTMPGRLSAAEIHHLYVSLARACELTRASEQARPLYGAMLKQVLRAAAQDDEPIGLAKREWYRAMIDLYTADLATAITHGERALALARNLGQSDLIVQSLDALTSIKQQLGAWEEHERLATEAHALYVAMRDRAMEADCLCLLANAYLHRGRLLEASSQARSALTINQEIENIWGQVNAMYELSSGLLDMGAYTEALEIAQQAVASTRILSTRSSWANTMLLRSLMQLGSVYRAIQASHAAREVDLEALKLNEAIVSQPYTAFVAMALCADYALAGEWTDAYRYARQAVIAEGSNALSNVVIPRWFVTEALLRGGDVALAKAHIARLSTHNGDGRRDRIQYLRAFAGLARWEGHLDQALSSLEEARALAEEIGLPGELWYVQATRAELYQSRGEQMPAGQALTQAATVVEGLAAKIEDEARRSSFLSAPQVQRVLEQAARGADLPPYDR
ncbi:MAG TPA: AAA family ATPase [Ktedonobacteraceae bacterium]|nr:AAA family ATPase [Ktedonobacteraceae bacterium]